MKPKQGLALLTIAFFVASCGLTRLKPDIRFNKSSTTGELQTGMSVHEVRGLLGIPEKVSTRKLSTDVRSVWEYEDYVVRNTGPYFFLGVITFGVGFFLTPGYFETHYLVFSDDKVIGWDLPDPYAPDLIIENRFR